jgi:lipopolysaccharide export system permease protein
MFVLLMNFLFKYIDELVGKGLSGDVITELLGYMMITLVPMGLPLAIMLGAIMTMGNLGENYELLAMKSAGMSLMRIMSPTLIVTGMIAVGSFFLSNDLVPFSWQRAHALLFDVRRQKQNVEFKDGIFFTGIDGMSIRVEHQRPTDNLLQGVLIYDNTDRSRTVKTTLADSGYIRLSDDKQNLMVTLYNGTMYETNRQDRGNAWWNDDKVTVNHFVEQYVVSPLTGFDMERTDTEMFDQGASKKIRELERNIDSMTTVVADRVESTYSPLFNQYIFRNDPSMMTDSLRATTTHVKPVEALDSLAGLGLVERQKLWRSATAMAQNSRSMMNWDEQMLKESLRTLYDHQISWHEKVVLPFSILIFFLIGASLGAIIRRGGLGMPIVVSVIFFVVYYVINVLGRQMAIEGTVSALVGMWMSSLILLPIAVFLTVKATNDSNLFNPEWYIYRWRALKKLIIRK